MSIKDLFKVIKINNSLVDEWIMNKHYAKRQCSISYAFGLFDCEKLVGVCTFGFPPNYNYNNGACVFNNYSVLTLELNRLITNDDLPRNALSYFVSKSLNMLPKPTCIVSYSDPNAGHNGYIYQATNWIYTGESTPKIKYHFEDGYTFDIRRGIDDKIKEHGKIVFEEKLLPTKRYIYFNGNKKEKKEMLKHFKMKNLPYTKGDNVNYDASYKTKDIKLSDLEEQLSLF